MEKNLKTLTNFGAQIRTNLEVLSLLKKNNINGMAGYCAVGSLLLHRVAEIHSIKTNFILGVFKQTPHSKKKSGHCWLEFEDNILDITASQFGIKNRIFVTKLNDLRYKVIVKNDLAVFAVEKHWPFEQKPSSYSKDLINISKVVNDIALEISQKEQKNVSSDA